MAAIANLTGIEAMDHGAKTGRFTAVLNFNGESEANTKIPHEVIMGALGFSDRDFAATQKIEIKEVTTSNTGAHVGIAMQNGDGSKFTCAQRHTHYDPETGAKAFHHVAKPNSSETVNTVLNLNARDLTPEELKTGIARQSRWQNAVKIYAEGGDLGHDVRTVSAEGPDGTTVHRSLVPVATETDGASPVSWVFHRNKDAGAEFFNGAYAEGKRPEVTHDGKRFIVCSPKEIKEVVGQLEEKLKPVSKLDGINIKAKTVDGSASHGQVHVTFDLHRKTLAEQIGHEIGIGEDSHGLPFTTEMGAKLLGGETVDGPGSTVFGGDAIAHKAFQVKVGECDGMESVPVAKVTETVGASGLD